MKIKSMIAALAASAIAVSAMAVTASAKITNPQNDDENTKYIVDVMASLPEGCSVTDVYGAQFTFEGYDAEQGTGGGFVWNSNSQSWNQKEWGNDGSNKAIIYGDDLVVKRLEDAPVFAATDEYAQVAIAQWDGWGVDITITDFKLLGQDGNELQAKEAPTQTTAPEGDNNSTAETTTTKKTNATSSGSSSSSSSSSSTSSTKTGDAGVGIAVAALSLAGAAAFATRKKH